MKNLKYKFFPVVKKWSAVFSVSLIGAWLTTASVVKASDLQIYAVPTAGQKTLIMMLDTSGSMGYGAGYSSGSMSIKSDYGVCTNINTITSGASYQDGKLYTVASTTVPSYSRNFCYVSKSTALSNASVTDTTTGCEPQSGGAYRCYDRLTRLVDGMYALLNTDSTSLNKALIGVGNFSANGDGKTGQILVPAAILGAGSTANTVGSQRYLLKQAISGLSANNGTPTANAYTEAAAYLMGTNTIQQSPIVLNNAPVYFNYSGSRTWATCSAWNSSKTACSYWQGTSTTVPSTAGLTSFSCTQFIDDQQRNYTGTCWRGNSVSFSNYSGFANAPSATLNGSNYKSPLPAVADRVSCDGQGVYILSDGAANSSSTDIAQSLMKTSLPGKTFSCPTSGGLTTSDSTAAYNCIGEYAKALYDATKNPTGVSIQTAFVGFGSDFQTTTGGFFPNGADYALSSCQLGSRSQPDRKKDDICSPGTTPTSQAITAPGYGNGIFQIASTANDVTTSVTTFIDALGGTALKPLTTGSISVPYDALNPNGLQPYGYLRALEPNPAKNMLTWRGNLKRYNAVLSGTNAGAFSDTSSNLVFDSKGNFNSGTKDLWNNSTYSDGGIIDLGGAYSRVPQPANGQAQTLNQDGSISKYTFPQSISLRNLFTDADSVTSGVITPISTANTSLLQIPTPPTSANTTTATALASYVLAKFNASTGQTTLKDFSIATKLNLLNYLGYPVNTTQSTLPTSLTTPDAPYHSMGGAIHSYPTQLTYSGALDAGGNLTTTRSQSIMYGSMEGGLHIVDGSTGVEQMVFIPSSILNDSTAINALSVNSSTAGSPYQGLDGNWVSDPAYNITTTQTGSNVTAKQMNVYGGMRMGGSSYYGLDVLTPANPKLLFRIGPDISNYSTMGQSWSKPVLANIRYNNQIKRVMIVGGGYDTCYENPAFQLNASVSTTEFPDTSCNNKVSAKGNAVYIIDAKTGQRLWWASNTGADTTNVNMTNSIVSRISTLDRDGDGLVDHLYFGDLGGQVFRIDLNNKFGTATSNFGVRVTRLANLATAAGSNGYTGTVYTGASAPRFYEPPTVTIHDQGANTFILVGIASGNRSTPLDVAPLKGRDGLLPSNAATKPVNNVYGLIDRDFIKPGLITGTPAVTLESQDSTFANLVGNPQLLASGTVIATFFPVSGTGVAGWFRSLSSTSAGVEKATSTGIRVPGGLKGFEEPMAITNNLLVSVYDPQGTGVSPNDPCQPRVVGETDWQKYCLPFGVCLNSNGETDTTSESKSGFVIDSSGVNGNVIGSGIRGIAMVPTTPSSSSINNSCGALKFAGNISGTGEWQCTSHLIPTRWFQRYR